LEGKNFYKRREYSNDKYYPVPIPYRALSEFEIWECQEKAMESLENKDLIKDLKTGDKVTVEQALVLAKLSKLTDYWLVFYSLVDFVEGLTFNLVKKVRGVSELAEKIRTSSGLGREEEVEDF